MKQHGQEEVEGLVSRNQFQIIKWAGQLAKQKEAFLISLWLPTLILVLKFILLIT